MLSPEDQARENIDRMLAQASWAVFNQSDANISAAKGVAIRNFTLKSGHGFADYLLYVNGRAAGVIEAKKEGVTLTGVETQSDKYTKGLPAEFVLTLITVRLIIGFNQDPAYTRAWPTP
jgi:type I restriction enzyme R subunit